MAYMLLPGDTVQEWEIGSKTALNVLREKACDPTFWESLKVHYAEENQSDSINWDDVSFVKSICTSLFDRLH